MSKQTSLYLNDEQVDVVDALIQASASIDAVDGVLGQSEVLRRLVDTGIEEVVDGDLDAVLDSDDVDADGLIPEHVRIKHRREAVKDRNRVEDWRGGFEGRVSDAFMARFQGDDPYRPADLDRVADGYREEARALWPDDEERREAAIEHVDALVEDYRAAFETSTFEAERFNRFEGVREAAEAEDVPMRDLVNEAREAINGGASDTDALATALSNRLGVSESRASEAIQYAIESDGNDDVEGGEVDE